MNIRELVGAIVATLALAGAAHAQQQFFRIGTGVAGGTDYPIGGLIANAVSQPGRIVVAAQPSNGSLANLNAFAIGAAEAGFAPSDLANWAYTGTGSFEGKAKAGDLRLIANLYPESIQLVVRKSAAIKSPADLKGKRVAFAEPGSAALVEERAVLAAYAVKESELKPEYIKPDAAARKLKDGTLDAFFVVGGAPAAAISELAAGDVGIELVPLAGPEAQALLKASPWFSAETIPAGTYKDVPATATLAVGVQLVTSDKVDPETVYQITKAMFSEQAQKLFQAGHAKGRFITKENAIKAAGIPFHPGAERFYKEAGLIK